MILMYKNTPVLQFDVDKNQYNIFRIILNWCWVL